MSRIRKIQQPACLRVLHYVSRETCYKWHRLNNPSEELICISEQHSYEWRKLEDIDKQFICKSKTNEGNAYVAIKF